MKCRIAASQMSGEESPTTTAMLEILCESLRPARQATSHEAARRQRTGEGEPAVHLPPPAAQIARLRPQHAFPGGSPPRVLTW